ncbi:hypothetical protein SVAN01_06676 [Stagonosporopsis vannaccii]|nr:hypothetical protein SVAN01_06676 [Stagonosporopsis vannaccii]
MMAASNSDEPLQLRLKVINLDSKFQQRPLQHRSSEEAQCNHGSVIAKVANYEIEERSAFTALSYVWGAEAPLHNIYIEQDHDYGWIPVRQNLFEFLKTMRHHLMDGQENGHQRSLTLPYWSRLWVVQEITFNKDTTLRLGTETITWDKAFRHACLQFGLQIMADVKLIDEPAQFPIHALLTMRVDMELDWCSAWAFAVERECCQSQDKAFALMALLPNTLRF